MANFDPTSIAASMRPGDSVFVKIKTQEDEKELKGYQYDSLVYRYIRAREAMAQWEWERDHQSREREWYFQQANRDIARFCQILHEAIGEHN